jgi:hypothetical protein
MRWQKDDEQATQFGGFCAWAVAKGGTAKIEPDAFQIVDGRLLLQYDKSVRATFSKDTRGNLAKADANWPKIVAGRAKEESRCRFVGNIPRPHALFVA